MGETNKISVETVPCYIPSKSSPKDNRYVFAYTITISNIGTVAA
ncbi:MAG: ApaG domain, partial [Methylococcales bacterium]|nr:ApaG domain [Methylococcales bacterium]